VIGVVLITYGDTGDCLCKAAAHVLGERLSHIEIIAIHDTPDTVDKLPDRIETALGRLGCTQYLLLVDLPGSTHFNVSRGFTRLDNVAMLTGVNLPMLLRVMNHRECELDELLHFGSDGGVQGILSFYPASYTETGSGT
jgi:mannose/fructose-specific phosphotransferase system component IIA